jgi:hypothetical protein
MIERALLELPATELGERNIFGTEVPVESLKEKETQRETGVSSKPLNEHYCAFARATGAASTGYAAVSSSPMFARISKTPRWAPSNSSEIERTSIWNNYSIENQLLGNRYDSLSATEAFG